MDGPARLHPVKLCVTVNLMFLTQLIHLTSTVKSCHAAACRSLTRVQYPGAGGKSHGAGAARDR